MIEFRSADSPQTLEELVQKYGQTMGASIPPLNQYVFYVNDRRWESLQRKIRPRSKILGVPKEEPPAPLSIVFESKELIVLNKKHGLPTQKTYKIFEDNLYDQVRRTLALEKSFPQGLPYVGLHHRLDRDTSGLVLMTKQRSANREISDLFKNRAIEKSYLAYVEASDQTPESSWRQVDNIGRGRHPKHKFYFQVLAKGDQAITHFSTLKSKESFWHLIRCLPKTGRTHQLRVQLAHRGFPILGDPLYGSKRTAPRLMLHAESLKFRFKGEDHNIQCPPDWDWDSAEGPLPSDPLK